MKKVMWISRHQMSNEQLSDLKNRLKDNCEITQYDHTYKNIESLKRYFGDFDVIAAVLPIELLAELVASAGDVPVLIARTSRPVVAQSVANGCETEYAFKHAGWEQIIKLEIDTRDFFLA